MVTTPEVTCSNVLEEPPLSKILEKKMDKNKVQTAAYSRS